MIKTFSMSPAGGLEPSTKAKDPAQTFITTTYDGQGCFRELKRLLKSTLVLSDCLRTVSFVPQ